MIKNPCNCESDACGHGHLAVTADGGDVAIYVGAVCADCAASHMAPYLVAEVEARWQAMQGTLNGDTDLL